MSGLKPNETIYIETTEGNYTLTLGYDSKNSSRAIIGIGFPQEEGGNLVKIIKKFVAKKDSFTYYAPRGELSVFVYNLLLWVLLINISVMLINMLPFGIFDGGRFFYLSVLGITKSKKKALKGFKIANTFILLILIALMVVWLFRAF